jgi:hypothetical protein
VFDIVSLLPEGRPSVFDEELRRWLDADRPAVEAIRPQPVTVVDYRPHGRRDDLGEASTASTDPAEAQSPMEPQEAVDPPASGGPRESVEPEWRSFAGRLEAGAGHLCAARAAHVEQCRWAAVQARELAAFAAQRPAAVLDRPDEEVGAAAAASRAARPAALTAVSEWAVDEVMVAFGLSSVAASQLLAESVGLVEQLPATLAALQAGVIGWNHARMLTEVLSPLQPAARAEVEARLLARAGGQTVPQLRMAARRAVLRADATAAARRLAAAIRARAVRLYPGADGMGSLAATLSLPVAVACRRALQAYAEDCATPGDERTQEQRMVDCLVDLILRPGINGPVQIGLTVVAGVDTMTGGDEPGEVDGHPVPAVVVRELAHALGLLPRPEQPAEPITAELTTAEPSFVQPTTVEPGAAEPAGTEPANTEPANTEPANTRPANARPAHARPASGGGAGRVAAEELSASEAAAARLADLLGIRTTAGTALARLPQIAVVHEISGQLLALTSAAQIRRTATCRRPDCRTGVTPCTHPADGPGLGPPPATPGYAPSTALQRFVRARDRRCRFPGCRARAIRCDLDHNTPWPAGATSAGNLCCLCRHHHRLRHQAPGWTMRRLPDGGLQWTTPGGERITTHPPRYGTDDDLPPPTPPGPTANSTARAAPDAAVTPPLTARERLLGRPHPPGTIDIDPPPF